MAERTIEEQEALARLADENALLRASLAEMRARLGELEQSADNDTLTPLPNRRRFVAELERVVSHCARHGTPAAIVYLDVNGLDAVNDRHGRLAGDAALIHVARQLQGLIRTSDVAARIGGDEFGLILEHLDHNSAIETAERIARCISASPVDLGNARIPLDLAVGVATILPGDSCEDVMRRAELNVKRAKNGF